MDGRIKGLDGLRAPAIVLVFITHKIPLAYLRDLGGYGVHMFFVLSGFLIIGILNRQRQKIETGRSDFVREWCSFTVKRAFRIFPAYFLVVALIVFAYKPPLLLIAQFLTYTNNLNIAYRTFQYPTVGGHLWSLSVEEQFYLLSAPLILALPSRSTWLICWAAIVLGIMGAVGLPFAGFPFRTSYVGPSTNFGLMGLGGLIAVTSARGSSIAWIGPAALLLYFVSPFAGYALERHSTLAPLLLFWLSPCLIAMTIFDIARRQSGILAQTLDIAPLRYLGRISYGFYLFHPFMLRLGRRIVHSSAEPNGVVHQDDIALVPGNGP